MLSEETPATPLGSLLARPQVRLGLHAATALLVLTVVFARLVPVPAPVLFIGVVTGSTSALIALGIVLVYRANRVINFAAGELGAVAGLLAALLQAGPGWGYVSSAVAGLAAALTVGAACEVLIIRRFQNAPRLILTVATIGVAQLLIFTELFLPRLFGSDLVLLEVASPFDFTFSWSPVVFEGGHLVAVVTVAVVAAALGAFLRRSSYGTAIRAAAESSDRAAQLGIPTRRLGTVVWTIAAGLAGIASLLRGPLIGVPLGAVLGPGLLLRAMAAAVIAQMESLPKAFGAAVFLGVIEQAVVWRTGDAVVVDAVLFAVVLAGLLLQRRRAQRTDEPPGSSWDLVGRARAVSSKVRALREVRMLQLILLFVVLEVSVVVPAFLSPSHVNLLGTGLILAMILLSLTVLTGWAGEISLGQMALVGFGAATAAKLSTLGWGFLPCLFAAGLVGALVSLAIGLPALRIRGPFLAVASFAFALATSAYFLNRSYFPSLIVAERISRPVLFSKFDLEHEHAYYYVLLALLVTTLLSLRALHNSRTGRVLLASRDNAAAAQAYGVDLLRARLTGFAVSGFVAAAAGGALVFHQHALSVNQYRPERSIEVFALAVFGGIGSLVGPIAGATFSTALTYFAPSDLAVLFVTALGLLVILLVLPGGLSSLVFRARDWAIRGLLSQNDVSPAAEDLGVRMTPPRVDPKAPESQGSALAIRDLSVAYGRLQVLSGVDLDLDHGEVLALLGTNGAGKSTLLRAVVGSVARRSGTVRLDGKQFAPRSPDVAAAHGVLLAPGGRGVFPSLTVDEHLKLAAWSFRRDAARVEEAATLSIERFPALATRRSVRAGALSGGEQQMLLLAQAFISRPKVLLIDELSLGLAPTVVADLAEIVRSFADAGTAVVLVEQSVNFAAALADRAVFLEKGEVRYDGPTRALLERPDLARSIFLGTPAGGGAARARPARPRRSEHGEGRDRTKRTAALDLRSVSVDFGGVAALRDVSVSVERGQIVGLIGSNGAGKTTLLDIASGFLRPRTGEVHLDGRDITSLAAHDRARMGLGRSFQSGRLFPSLSARETLAVALERHIRVRSAVAAMVAAPPSRESELLVAERVDELLETLHLQSYAEALVSELSTGTRRVVDLAAVLAHQPSVLLLDEPSSGLAQREAEALAPLLMSVRERTGTAMLIVEHDIPLLSSVADELVAMDRGEVVVRGEPEEVLHHPEVLQRYLGTSDAAILRSGPAA